MSSTSKSHSPLNAKEIAAALPRGRKCGRGFIACCPNHQDKNPSLSLRDAGDGVVLVHCFSGCSQRDVIEALRSKGLWPERRCERPWLTREEYRAQREREREAALFCLGFEPLLVELLAGLPPVETIAWDDEDPERLALTRELAALRVAQQDGRRLVQLYSKWQRDYPELAEAVTHVGLWREFRWSARLWRWWKAQQQSRRAAA